MDLARDLGLGASRPRLHDNPPVRVAVVGHVEWVEFVRGDHVPAAGEIVHATDSFEEPAGGGAVAAVQLARMAGDSTLVTALGRDDLAERSRERDFSISGNSSIRASWFSSWWRR